MNSPVSSRRAIVMALLVALIAIGVGYGCWSSRSKGPQWPLLLQGNVEIRQVNLGFKVAGRVQRLAVDEGDSVAQGQILGALEKVYFEEALGQLRAQRDQAIANFDKLEAGNRKEDIAQAQSLVTEREATLQNARTTFARAEQLWKTSNGTRKTYDDAVAAQREAAARLRSAREAFQLAQRGFRIEDVNVARAQLAEREAEVKIAERQLGDSELVAPSAGVVLTRVRENGAIVNAGETVFVLSLSSPVWVRAYVSEPDLGRVKPGMPVEVMTDTPGAALQKGRVGFISDTAEFTPKTVETRELRTALVYRLRIIVDNRDGALRQGMPITVSVPKPKDGDASGAQPR